MTRTFIHPLWKRAITVDDEGIHEHRQGRSYLSIRWDQIHTLNGSGVYGERGTRIILRLSPSDRRQFVECASTNWRQRHPEQWQRNVERAGKAATRTAYFWFPLVALGPCVTCYLLFWFLGWPENLEAELQKIHRLTILGVLCVTLFWIWFGYRKRKYL